MKRIAFYLFYDPIGQVDDYVVRALEGFMPYVDELVVVCNGVPSEAGMARLRASSTSVMIRENSGFDVGGYKDALLRYGRGALRAYDEVILMNYTFFAPLFPLSEMFGQMAQRDCDFWGITAHKACVSPFDSSANLPFHIQSHFIAIRTKIIDSQLFWSYWQKMPQINSYSDSVTMHEARFTEYFSNEGYKYALYMDPDDFESDHPVFVEVDKMIEKRCPIIKRRALFHDPLYIESEAIDVRRAIDLIEMKTDYPVADIWKNILRAGEPRKLYTNLEQLSVLPHVRVDSVDPNWRTWRVAALIHLYYPEMVEEIFSYIENVPLEIDIYITTDTQQKKDQITDLISKTGIKNRAEIRVTESNLGRDTSGLLISCRDVVLSGKYELICRLHGKKSPQDGPSRGSSFKRHLFENLLGSPGYVENIFDLFSKMPLIGIVMPPVVHIGYPTLGHAWFTNKERTRKLAEELEINADFDSHTPLAPLGSMYWFRPEALRPLFEKKWKWSDFEESSYGDGDLPHAIERLICYCAQSGGYLTWCVMTPEMAAKNYVKLEYKYQILSSCFPMGDVTGQVVTMLQRAKHEKQPTIKASLGIMKRAVISSFQHRFGSFF